MVCMSCVTMNTKLTTSVLLVIILDVDYQHSIQPERLTRLKGQDYLVIDFGTCDLNFLNVQPGCITFSKDDLICMLILSLCRVFAH